MDKFNRKYGFMPANDDCIGECEDNPLIVPKLFRYQGMGHYQILAGVKDVPNRYFLIDVGGSNGYEQEAAHDDLKKLTIDDSITMKQLESRVKKGMWVEVVSTTHYEGGDVNECIEHNQN